MSILGIVQTEMENMGIPYEFMRYTSPVNGRYWIGEWSESPVTAEDGSRHGTMLLTGTTRANWLELYQDREKIENRFPSVYGLRKSTENGTAVFYYGNTFPVDTGEENLKRIQINVDVYEWRCEK